MAYTKQTWANLPSKTTPINASRLDHIEQGIFDAAQVADTANAAISNLGSAASKNSTNIVDAGSEDLVESGAVYNALDTAFSNVVPKYSLDSSQWDDVPTNNSNKPVTSDGVYDGLNDIVTEAAEMGAKNIIPYPYGTRQKVANDGTISSNSGYYLSDYVPIGKIKTFTISFSDHGTVSFKVAKYNSSKTFIELSSFSDGDTMSLANTVAYVRFNFEDDGTNYLSYAMACYSHNLNDMSYEPYAMTNKQITDVLMNMDTVPTQSSTKPVTSGGVYNAVLGSNRLVKDTVGWSGKNLCNPSYITDGSSTIYRAIYVGDGTYTLSTTAPLNSSDGANLFLLAGDVSSGGATATNGVWNNKPRTVDAVNGYVTIASRNTGGVDVTQYNTQLERNSSPTTYEPYHASVDAVKADNSVIAPVENGDNASQGYYEGQHFIKEGAFCTATADMAQGDALANKYSSGKMTDFIPKKAVFTGTSSATTGNIKLASSLRHILSIKNTNGKIIIPYTIDSGAYMGTWAHVCNANDLTAALGESVNIEYLYI